MKRRHFITAFALLPPLLQACEKDKFPSTPTVITGKIVDINDKPVAGIRLSFEGGYKRGLSTYISTFDIMVKTNADGVYRIEQVVSSGTEYYNFLPDGIPPLSDIYVWKNNQYEQVGNPVGPIIYGETNTFNFQLRQR